MRATDSVTELPVARLWTGPAGRSPARLQEALPSGFRTVHDTPWVGDSNTIGLETLPQEAVQDPESFRTFLVSLRTSKRHAGAQHAAGFVNGRPWCTIPHEWMMFLVLFLGTQHENEKSEIYVPYLFRQNVLVTWGMGAGNFVEKENFSRCLTPKTRIAVFSI